MNRRTFLKAGIVGSVVLAGAGVIALRNPPGVAPGMRFLSTDGTLLMGALVPVVLQDALPEDAGARAVAVNDVIEAFDRAVAGMTPSIQGEISELIGLLTFAPSRCLVAGVWSAWQQASAADVQGFLNGWRDSRFSLLRAGYQALTQLILAAWYGNPLAWGSLAYVPPELNAA